MAAALLAATGPAQASHTYTPVLRWPDLEPGGDGAINYFFCVPDPPAEWTTAIEQRWDNALTWSFNVQAGNCNAQTTVKWESDNETCDALGLADSVACFDGSFYVPDPVPHGSHMDRVRALILVDRPKWDLRSSSWKVAGMAHEWGHGMGLADHDQASQQVAGTLMNHTVEDPPYYDGPTKGDISSVRCLENWICHTPGVWRAGSWLIRYSNSTGADGNAVAEGVFEYKLATDKPLAGDWDGNGTERAGVYRPSNATFYLSNDNMSDSITAPYGNGGDTPLTGDWDGDGDDTIGVYRPSEAKFYLSNNNSTTWLAVPYGNAGDVPLSGDWDGDGDDNIGVYRPSNATFYLTINNSTTWFTAWFGNVGDTPMGGDWNADGNDTIGVWRGATWYLRNTNTSGQADISYLYGNGTDTPVKADWQ